MIQYNKIKRIGDAIISGIGIIIVSPVFLIIALLIKIESRGPVFFKQKRIGINKTIFQIYKFRTMRADTPKDTPTHLFENHEHFITRSGRFLRKSSFDELPQIFNIFKGEMSIIGPRPALWNQDDLIEQRDLFNANSIIPGLTGWAQVNGRDELPIPIKAQLDGYYVEKCSFALDMKIFWYTIRNIITRKGIVEGKNQP